MAFQVLPVARPDDLESSAFTVTLDRGFLPQGDPVVRLPSDFDALESILSRMPIKTANGSPGLLSKGLLKEVVDKELPDLSNVIDKYQVNVPLITALYRDYSFLASAYLLEPCLSHVFHVSSYVLL